MFCLDVIKVNRLLHIFLGMWERIKGNWGNLNISPIQPIINRGFNALIPLDNCANKKWNTEKLTFLLTSLNYSPHVLFLDQPFDADNIWKHYGKKAKLLILIDRLFGVSINFSVISRRFLSICKLPVLPAYFSWHQSVSHNASNATMSAAITTHFKVFGTMTQPGIKPATCHTIF